jgi:hypothetical protein
MQRTHGRPAHLVTLAIFAFATGCGTEHLVTGPVERATDKITAAGPADTGSVLRDKWIARLHARELEIAGPNRWFSMQGAELERLRATRALIDGPFASSSLKTTGAARRSIDDEICWAVCIWGATSPSISAGNIMVATLASYHVFRLAYEGNYNVYINRKALGGGSYADQAFDVAGFGSTTGMNISALASDTIEAFAASRHDGELFHNTPLPSVNSFGHDAVTPPLQPITPLDLETSGAGGPDEGMWCLLHYRSWDGGRTWYFMWADNCTEGKYKGVLAAGALPSASATPLANQQPAAASSEQQPTSGTFVVLGQDKLEEGQRAVVYVRPGLSPDAVIAVDQSHARPIDLADALATLMRFRAGTDSREAGSLHKLVVTKRIKPGVLSADGRARLAGYLAALAKAPRVSVPGVGDGNAVEAWLPGRR